MSDVQTREQIPLLHLEPELETHAHEFRDAMERVMRSGRFILGPEVEGFDEEAAEYLETEHAVSVNSGTDAPVTCHRLPVYDDRDFPAMPVSERAAEEVVSLPIWPQLEAETQELVSAEIRETLET